MVQLANNMKKIVIKLKSEKKQEKIKLNKKNVMSCPICGQHMDMCVTSHKNKPFVDNKLYAKMCFTCFSVPKILQQKYDEKGYISEQIELSYDKKNLHTAEELVHEGSADSLDQAKKCVRSVKKLVVEKHINNKIKPKLEFHIAE